MNKQDYPFEHASKSYHIGAEREGRRGWTGPPQDGGQRPRRGQTWLLKRFRFCFLLCYCSSADSGRDGASLKPGGRFLSNVAL